MNPATCVRVEHRLLSPARRLIEKHNNETSQICSPPSGVHGLLDALDQILDMVGRPGSTS